MSTIKPFTHDTIKAYLDRFGLRALRDDDGDFCLGFAPDDLEQEFKVWLIANGPQHEVYTVRMHTSARIARSEWPEWLRLVNQWNQQHRWPKAYLHARDWENDTRAEIILEAHLDLEEGIHQELFDDFTHATIAGAFGFWQWIAESMTTLTV